ncbi:MAG: hypothetical protein ACO1NW_07680 [Chitinophagaceae bacterium]
MNTIKIHYFDDRQWIAVIPVYIGQKMMWMLALILGVIFVAFCLFYYLEQRRRIRMDERRERFREKQQALVEGLRGTAAVDSSNSLSRLITAQLKFIQDAKAIEEAFGSILSSNMSEQAKVRRLAEVVFAAPGQPIIAKRLCMFLQVLNEESLLAQFGLEDIESLFVQAVHLYPDDVDLRLEYVYFLYNVLDREEEALAYFKALKEDVLEQLAEFERSIEE